MAIKKRSKKKTVKKSAKKIKKKQQKKPVKAKQKKTVKKPVKKKVKTAVKPKKAVKAGKALPAAAKVLTPEPKKEKAGKHWDSIRKQLLQQREQILREAKVEISKYIKGETKQLVDTALDDGDWSIVDLSEDISLRQLGTHRETLRKIDAALRKLEEGTYGICEECSEEISKQRLFVMPFAIYCRDCQEKIEQLEAIEKELK